MSPGAGPRKHVPQRSCVVCRRVIPKRDLTRIVVRKDEGLAIDVGGKMAGRGAYLCERSSCWESASHGDALGNGLNYRLTEGDRRMIAKHGAERRPHLTNDSNYD